MIKICVRNVCSAHKLDSMEKNKYTHQLSGFYCYAPMQLVSGGGEKKPKPTVRLYYIDYILDSDSIGFCVFTHCVRLSSADWKTFIKIFDKLIKTFFGKKPKKSLKNLYRVSVWVYRKINSINSSPLARCAL
jgi:hypothetical protein